MSDTTQLKALRDAARTMRDLPNVADSMIGAYLGIECAADRAIAAIGAAEQPKPCACGGGAGTSGWSHSIHGCHHLPKPPAEQPCAMCVASNCVCHCKLPCSKHSAKAAPVPAPASIPLAQHEAEVAQARREGLREALEAVCATGEGEASRANTAIRRALAEKGGEVGK